MVGDEKGKKRRRGKVSRKKRVPLRTTQALKLSLTLLCSVLGLLQGVRPLSEYSRPAKVPDVHFA